MTTPILTWLLIVCMLSVFFLVHSVLVCRRERHTARAVHHLIEIGTETDELFVPGDATINDCDTLNDNDN